MAVDEDLDPKHGPKKKKDLSAHSIAELDAYIAALQDEIARAEAEKKKKQAYLATAGNFFKS